MFTPFRSTQTSSSGGTLTPWSTGRLGFPKAKGLVVVLGAAALLSTSCGATPTDTAADTGSDLAGIATSLGESENIELRSHPQKLDLGEKQKPKADKAKSIPPSVTLPPVVERPTIDLDRFRPKLPDHDWRVDDFEADLGPHRIAPEGDGASFLLRWDEDSARHPGHTGEYTEVADGPFTQIVDAGVWGVVFQRPGDDTIWHKNFVEETALITSADPNVTLLLEGVVMSDLDQGIVYYRTQLRDDVAFQYGDWLRAYDLATAVDTEIDVVAGWESYAHFNLIHTPRTISSAAGEGFVWSKTYDLPHGPQVEWYTCDGTGDPDCPFYEAIAAGSTTTYAMVKDDPSASSTTYRLLGINPGTGFTYTIHTFVWEAGEWDIEEFFVTNGGLVVISVMDGAGDPLPAAIVDPSTDQVWTVPEADFVRPALLS